MKKIIGILGVAAIAATMFFSTNNVNSSSSDLSLSNLINMNTAHAQDEGTWSLDPFFYKVLDVKYECAATKWENIDYYDSYGQIVGNYYAVNGSATSTYNGRWTSYRKTTGGRAAVTLTGRDCPSGWDPFCNVNDPCNDDI